MNVNYIHTSTYAYIVLLPKALGRKNYLRLTVILNLLYLNIVLLPFIFLITLYYCPGRFSAVPRFPLGSCYLCLFLLPLGLQTLCFPIIV